MIQIWKKSHHSQCSKMHRLILRQDTTGYRQSTAGTTERSITTRLSHHQTKTQS